MLSTKQDYSEILDGLGERWEAALNTYKPFACGIVIHPTIDGCCQLRMELGEAVKTIEAVELIANPLVLELTGKTEPRTGLEGKFSVYHAAAIALLRGDGSPAAFTDEAVADPAVIALRQRVRVTGDKSVAEDAVRITVTLADGRKIGKNIEHAIGSLDHPLSDAQLEEKFRNASAPVIGEEAAAEVLGLGWDLESLPNIGTLAAKTVPVWK